MSKKITNFGEAVKKLQIEEYSDRIINSNSRGELFHLWDYISLANQVTDVKLFKQIFTKCVKHAEKTWERPESILQHPFKMYEYILQIE